MKCTKCEKNEVSNMHGHHSAKLCSDCRLESLKFSEPRISNCAICEKKVITKRGRMKLICEKCREKYMWNGKRYLQGVDFVREIRRVIGGHICELCEKKWKPPMRRFDVHHPEDYGKSTRKYQQLGDLLGTIVLCHPCHMRLPETRLSIRAAAASRNVFCGA